MSQKIIFSASGEMNKYDWHSVLMTLGIGIIGAVLTYLISELSSIEVSGTFAILMPLVITILKIAQKYFSNKTYVEEK